MGASNSKQVEKPSPEFETPWRSTSFEKKDDLEKSMREFKLSSSEVKYVRILLTGGVGAGKSSFINSINSAFQKRITTEALVNSMSGDSFTKTYSTYCIRSGETILPFVFNDVMGFKKAELKGAQQDDIVKALQGYLMEGQNFNPVSAVSVDGEGYRSNPTPQDRTHCLVYVMAADKVSMMKSNVIKKMQYVRTKANELGIPQAIIMTRVDEACPLVKQDLKKIYTSKKIKEKMEECNNLIGVPVCHIFPVKNYHEEMDTNSDIDELLLRALKHIVEIANDKLAKSSK